MFKGLTARSFMLSTLAVTTLTACGGAGLLEPNKKSMRGDTDARQDSGDLTEGAGSLSLTMPAGHAQFANVSTIEIRMWTERYGVDQETTHKVICQTSNPPRCFDENRREVPPLTALSPSTGRGAPIVRRFAYKAGEKAHVSDVPTGEVFIEIDLLDASNHPLFTGSGSAQVQKGQTAAAMVYVSPTPGKGGINISIQPPPLPVTSPASSPDREVSVCRKPDLPKK